MAPGRRDASARANPYPQFIPNHSAAPGPDRLLVAGLGVQDPPSLSKHKGSPTRPQSRPFRTDHSTIGKTVWLGARVFGAKTQGHPYPVAIIAAGLLIEAHFPGAALLFGDVDEVAVHAAMRWATEMLGRELPTLVLFDKEALFGRLARKWRSGELIVAFASRFMGT